MKIKRSGFREAGMNRLIEAALDQRNPSEELKLALQDVLIVTQHPDRLRSELEG